MIIGIEAQRLFRPRKHGMDIVAWEILKRICSVDPDNQYIIYVRKGVDVCLNPSPNMIITSFSSFSFGWWEQVILPRKIRRDKCDILHCTSNTAPLNVRIPLVLTLHDIIFIEKSVWKILFGKGTLYQRLGNVYRKWIVPRLIHKKNIHIITVSESEKKKICDKLNIPTEKVQVVYNAAGVHFKEMTTDEKTEARKRLNLPEQFILFHGNTDPKKNQLGVLTAYKNYLEKTDSPLLDLVITDISKEFVEKQCTENQLTEILPHLRFTGYVSNLKMPELYNLCSLFLYPSLREGFGIPILEAQACGVPVISSDCSSMPEVSGQSAYLVNPKDDTELANAILNVLNDNELQLKLVALGRENAKRFSWENATNVIVKLYKSYS